MRRRLLVHALPIFILCWLLLIPQVASAELLAGAHLGYGRTTYSQVLGEKSVQNTEWSSGIWANYSQADLLFTGLYQGSLGLQEFKASRHLAHAGASYLFLAEDALQVYGGLGYQLVSTRFETPQVDSGERNTLTGHGFAGQVVVNIALNDQFRTAATIIASPWANWSHNVTNNTRHAIGSGSSFVYKLELFYDFSSDFGAQLSLLGNNYRVDDDGGTADTKSSSASINLGATLRF